MKYFNRLLSTLIVFVLWTSVCAQKPLRNDTVYADADMSLMSTKVSMEINQALFPRSQGSMFISESPRAMIMPMVLRANFDSLDQTKLLAETAKEMDMKILKKGRIKQNGKIAYFISGSTKDKDRNILLEVYFVKGDADRTIMISGFYDVEAKKIYGKQIRNAAFSARLE